MADITTIEEVHRLMLEVAECRGKMKTVKDNLKDVLEQNDEYRALQEELQELTGKRSAAKKLLESDKDFQVVNSELEELKYQYKDLQEILSHHLVTYFSETNETQISSPEGDAVQVVVSAKIGKSVAAK